MVARKENKEYKIQPSEVNGFIARGFDIYENNKLVKYGADKKISYAEYDIAIKKIEELESKVLNNTEVSELKTKLDVVSKELKVSNDKNIFLEKENKEIKTELDKVSKELEKIKK